MRSRLFLVIRLRADLEQREEEGRREGPAAREPTRGLMEGQMRRKVQALGRIAQVSCRGAGEGIVLKLLSLQRG